MQLNKVMLTRVLVAVAVAVICSSTSVRATAVAPIVTTNLGEVSGFVDDTINCYHGIPVGAPPVGDLRFAPPKPASPWTGVFNGSITPPVCAQIPILHKDVVGVEDCLTVNVYTPSAGDASKLPVMLWIYGGGWVEGDSWEKGRYNGVKMAKARNVVVVAINYRLGALGFMALPSLAAESGQVGNVGLLDQRLGMQWVQDNIAAFGGDKSRVAIFGESAGGFSVCFHLVSPGSKGLFAAAIMESGTCESHGFFVPRDQAYDFSNAVAESVKCSGSGADQLACLRSLSVTALLDSNLTRVPIIGMSLAQAAVKSFYTGLGLDDHSLPAATGLTPEMAPIMPWAAVIDGVNLLQVPLQSLRDNTWADVPVIFGTNLNEGTIFVPALVLVVPGTPFPPTPAAMQKALPHFFSHYTTNTTASQLAAALTLQHYPLSQFKNNTWHQAAAIMTDWFFTCATRRAARAITDNGGDAWVYQFTQKLPWLEYDILGDFHGSEVYLVFGYSDLLHPFNSDVTSLSDAMQSYWTSMAYHGTPNSGVSGAPLNWPKFNATALQTVDLTWPLQTVSNLDGSICDFWDETLAHFAN